ncbi:MAG: hypothetical protein ACI85F_000325 [Bacteroidia bacterium]|jgi:hypothetical protein
MRFLVSEHKAFLAEIEKSCLTKERFSFLKKGGVLFVNCENYEPKFSFHRKKETILNDENLWEKKVAYHFDKPSKSSVQTDWDGILFAFGIWLSGIK